MLGLEESAAGVVVPKRMLLVASKSGALGASPSLVEGGVGSGVAGRDLSVMFESNGEGRGETDNFGDARRLSFRGGRRTFSCGGASLFELPARAAALAAASSFLFANKAFARTALAGNSSSSCLP